ncbi:hypothetical protein [Microbacterium sp. NPDC087665]|uniref:hypothetical protein n=1 Tax=Microbacterium sp. NPDC087665 TaxID=3364194 RepID=UPI0038104D03
MNTTDDNTPENTTRPFGFWLKAVDRLMADEFASAFEGEEIGRRDWRLLNIVDGSMPARRPLNGHKLHRLVERGWVAPEGDGWTLTDDGREAKDRLGAIVDGIRSKIGDAVSDEDMATTLASLEKIARAFGWDEETPLPRGRRHGFGGRGHGRFPKHFGPRHGFGRRHGFGPASDGEHARHGFGPEFGPGFEYGFEGHRDFGASAECRHGDRSRNHSHGEHGHGRDDHGHRGRGPHRAARLAQHSYERGFDAGFSRGRDA